MTTIRTRLRVSHVDNLTFIVDDDIAQEIDDHIYNSLMLLFKARPDLGIDPTTSHGEVHLQVADVEGGLDYFVFVLLHGADTGLGIGIQWHEEDTRFGFRVLPMPKDELLKHMTPYEPAPGCTH